MNAPAYKLSGELQEELAKSGAEVLPRLVTEYLDIRDQDNALKSRRESLRKQLVPLLEDMGGEYIDEVAGVRLYLDKTPRWQYDKERLYTLVTEGVMLQSEFDDCIETVVLKERVDALLEMGKITDRQLTRAGAKVPTKIVTTLQVKEIGRRRR